MRPTTLTLLLAFMLAIALAGCTPDGVIAEVLPWAWKGSTALAALIFARITIRSVFVRGLLSRLGQAADMIVLEVEQVYVDRVKLARADGVLTDQEAKEARRLALAKLTEYLGGKGLDLLGFVLGISSSTIGDMRATAVESSVAKLSLAQGAKATSPPR
jgi:hypothetical protein